MVGEAVLERHDHDVVFNTHEEVDLVAVEVLRAVVRGRGREDVDLGELRIDGQVVPTLVHDVVGFVLHDDINGHVAGVGVGRDAEVIGVERSQVRVVSVIVEQGQRLVFTGEDATIGRGDADGRRGAEVFVDLNAERVLTRHERGAVVDHPLVVVNRQFPLGQQGVLCDLERISAESGEDFTVEVAPLVRDGDGVPHVAVNVGWNGKFTGQGVADGEGGINVLEHGFPTVATDGGDVVFILAKGLTVVAPNGIGFVVLVLVEPLEAHDVQRTDGEGVLDARGVGRSGVLKGHLEVILDEPRVVVRAVDVAVERFGGDEVERVRSVFVIGHLNVVVADAVAHRAEVHHRLIFDELSTGHPVGGVPDVVDFALNAQLVVPGDSGGAVADELGMDVGGFGHPTVEGILFNAVGAGIARRVGVDHTRCIHGDDAVVGEAKEPLGHLNLVRVDALKNALNNQRHVVSQNG